MRIKTLSRSCRDRVRLAWLQMWSSKATQASSCLLGAVAQDKQLQCATALIMIKRWYHEQQSTPETQQFHCEELSPLAL